MIHMCLIAFGGRAIIRRSSADGQRPHRKRRVLAEHSIIVSCYSSITYSIGRHRLSECQRQRHHDGREAQVAEGETGAPERWCTGPELDIHTGTRRSAHTDMLFRLDLRARCGGRSWSARTLAPSLYNPIRPDVAQAATPSSPRSTNAARPATRRRSLRWSRSALLSMPRRPAAATIDVSFGRGVLGGCGGRL